MKCERCGAFPQTPSILLHTLSVHICTSCLRDFQTQPRVKKLWTEAQKIIDAKQARIHAPCGPAGLSRVREDLHKLTDEYAKSIDECMDYILSWLAEDVGQSED